MKIPILSGIYADSAPDFRTALPKNLVPVPKTQGISEGYLRVADGVVQYATAEGGAARGGIIWNGTLYRVQGTNFVSVAANGTVTNIGDVGGAGTVSMDYGFSYLAIASSGNLFLYDGSTLTQVTDSDLGTVLDVLWVDGYFMTTDGTNIVVTQLGDPFSVDPLKYGSSEVEPDPIVAIKKIRGEIYVINRYTVEVFQNVGGTGFPFSVISGAQIERGALGTHVVTELRGGIAFIGGGRSGKENEPPAVWLGANGATVKISTAEVDERIQSHSEATLRLALMEVLKHRGHETLLIHLPDVTLCYDVAASEALQQPVWYELDSGTGYLARHFVWQDRWTCGNPGDGSIGYLSKDVGSHWGVDIEWEFSTPIIYNEGRGVQFHEIEIVCLTGSAAVGDDPQVSTQYSLDGLEWSRKRWRSAGKVGERTHRIRWMGCGTMGNFRIQRFSGRSDALLAIARVQAREEALAW